MQAKNKNGFTLIELLVVVLIVGILSAVALPQYTTAVEKSRSAEALALMNAIAGSAERYRFQKDAWPGENEFTKLDIEVPQNPSSTSGYGGKNFDIVMDGSGNTFTISATRRVSKDQYRLVTQLTDANDTITAVRSCASINGNGGKYCDAITNGHNSDF